MDSLIQIEQFRATLIDMLNNSNLSLGVVYYVFKDVYRELVQSYNYFLQKEPEDKKRFSDNVVLDIDGSVVNSTISNDSQEKDNNDSNIDKEE